MKIKNQYEKLIAIVLTVSIIATSFSSLVQISAQTEEASIQVAQLTASEDGSMQAASKPVEPTKEFMISNENNFTEFMTESELWASNVKVNLACDIDMKGKVFNPIKEFNGVFDGCGHIISNLKVQEKTSKSKNSELAFINTLNKFAEIKNVTLDNYNIENKSSINKATGLVITNYGTISGVDIINSSMNNIDKKVKSAGFVLNNEEDGLIENCFLNMNIKDSKIRSGFVETNYGRIIKCSTTLSVDNKDIASGFVSENQGTIEKSNFKGDVSSKKYAVGFCGSNSGDIVSCKSEGNVKAKTQSIKVATICGGFVGENSGVIKECHSTGKVEGQEFTGGFVGINNDKGEISSCKATCDVKSHTNIVSIYCGGFAGLGAGKIENCSFYGTVKGCVDSEKVVGIAVGAVIGTIVLITVICLLVKYFKDKPELKRQAENIKGELEGARNNAENGYKAANEDYNKASDAYNKANEDYKKAVNNQIKANEDYKKASDAYNKANEDYKKAVNNQGKAYDACNKALDDFGKARDAYNKASDAYDKANEDYKKAVNNQIKAYDDYKKAVNNQGKAYDACNKALDDFGKATNDYDKAKNNWKKAEAAYKAFENINNAMVKLFFKDTFVISLLAGASIGGGALAAISGITIRETFGRKCAYVAGFCGFNAGEIIKCGANSGSIKAKTLYNKYNLCGGFVGTNGGTIKDSDATGKEICNETYTGGYLGGFVGENFGKIENGTTTVSVANGKCTGGFCGNNSGEITNSKSEGNAKTSATTVKTKCGGFVGNNEKGKIDGCKSTGSATGQEYVGGFAGSNKSEISDCNATGKATAKTKINNACAGGFVGENEKGAINNCKSIGGAYAKSSLGDAKSGGFAGINKASIIASQANGDVYLSAGVFYKDNGCGGFVGKNEKGSVIDGCYAECTIGTTNKKKGGGFVGEAENDSIIMNSNCKSKIVTKTGVKSQTKFYQDKDKKAVLESCISN